MRLFRPLFGLLLAAMGLCLAVVLAAAERRSAPPVEATHAAAPVPTPTRTRKIDEYGNISFRDERERLGNFAIELLAEHDAVGYIVGYGGRRARAREARLRIERAKRYLIQTGKIPPGKLVTIDGGFREELTVELFILPRAAEPPLPSPTVNPGEVITAHSRKRTRRPR
jgi:hypothetical protein